VGRGSVDICPAISTVAVQTTTPQPHMLTENVNVNSSKQVKIFLGA